MPYFNIQDDVYILPYSYYYTIKSVFHPLITEYNIDNLNLPFLLGIFFNLLPLKSANTETEFTFNGKKDNFIS